MDDVVGRRGLGKAPRWFARSLLALALIGPAASGQEGGPAERGEPGASAHAGLVRALPGAVTGRLRQTVPFASLFVPARVNSKVAGPGTPEAFGRPRPGSRFDPGAGGPGVSQNGDQNFLDGALDDRTGWPLVFLDHYRPRPERTEPLWIVSTRDCPQELGSDPWPKLQVLHTDADGRVAERPVADLMAAIAGRPVLIQVQGSLTTPDAAFGGLLWTHSWLDKHRSLPADAVVIAFDWPSQRIYGEDIRDINEKGRRAFVAGYHLAVLVSAFPPGSRACLLGQSYGGRVVPSALHVLGGGELHGRKREPTARLAAPRSDLRLRGVIIGGASDRNWLDPGERLDRTLHACEAFLNLYNRKDEALLLYPSLVRSDHHRALGRVGLSNADFRKLGPLAARYREYDVHESLGPEHTLLDAVANPGIARQIAPYTFAADPGPLPAQIENPPGVARGLIGPRLK